MNIAVVTNQPILAVGIHTVLRSCGQFDCIALTLDDARGIEPIRRIGPAIIVLDFTPDAFGLLMRLRRELPETHLILWARRMSPEVAFQAMKLGVRGILRSTIVNDMLVDCVRRVAGGGVWFDSDLNASILDVKTIALSARETQLVIMVSQGLKNKEIAKALSLSEATIRIYLSTLFRRLGVKDRYELAIYGARHVLDYARDGAAQAASATQGNGDGLRFMILEKPKRMAAG